LPEILYMVVGGNQVARIFYSIERYAPASLASRL